MSTYTYLRPPFLQRAKTCSTKMASPENKPPKCFIIRGVENTALKYHIVMGINDPITQLEELALFIFNCCSFTCRALITKTCQPSACNARKELQINYKCPRQLASLLKKRLCIYLFIYILFSFNWLFCLKITGQWRSI